MFTLRVTLWLGDPGDLLVCREEAVGMPGGLAPVVSAVSTVLPQQVNMGSLSTLPSSRRADAPVLGGCRQRQLFILVGSDYLRIKWSGHFGKLSRWAAELPQMKL